jgi:cytochrome c553
LNVRPKAQQLARPRNQRRAELASALAGVDVKQTPGGSAETSPVLDRSLRPPIIGHKTWVSLAAVALLTAASTAATEVGEQQREVNEVLHLTPNPVRGEEIFRYCAGCHTAASNGLPEGWVPNITGQHPRYLAKQLIDYRNSVRWDARMEPVAKGHGLRGSQDMADVVAFLAAQPADWNAPEKHPRGATEDDRFYRSHCSSCHGLNGAGSNARSIPRIAGQDFAYVLRQMHDVVDGRRANMRKQHLRALEDLDVLQLVSLSRYVSHLGEGEGEVSTPELTSFNMRSSSHTGVRPPLGVEAVAGARTACLSDPSMGLQ